MLATIYRFVGGFMGQGNTTTTRLLFSTFAAVYLAFAMIVKGFGWGDACTVLVTSFMLTYVGRLIPHGWTWQKGVMGYVYMSLIAFVRVGLWMAPAFYFMPELTPLCLLGLLSGACYAIGKNLLHGVDSGIYHCKKAMVSHSNVDGWSLSCSEEPSVYAIGWTEWGEVLTGHLCYSLPYALLLAL